MSTNATSDRLGTISPGTGARQSTAAQPPPPNAQAVVAWSQEW